MILVQMLLDLSYRYVNLIASILNEVLLGSEVRKFGVCLVWRTLADARRQDLISDEGCKLYRDERKQR